MRETTDRTNNLKYGELHLIPDDECLDAITTANLPSQSQPAPWRGGAELRARRAILRYSANEVRRLSKEVVLTLA